MSDTGKLIGQEPDTAIWEGLRQLAEMPGWLVEARSPERVCEILSHAIPEFNSGRLALKSCDTGHMLLKEHYWTGHYDLLAADPAANRESTVMLRGSIYPPGVLPPGGPQVSGDLGALNWQAAIPELNLKLQTREPETVLDSLGFLTDPQESRRYLEETIRAGSLAYSDFRIQTCKPKVVRYKPGSRCTIVFHLEYQLEDARKGWPELVVAKTYRGEKGQNAYDSMAALWNSPLGQSALKLAEPLAYDPARRILIQGPIREEQTLKELIVATIREGWKDEAVDVLNGYLRQTAAGLAELHQSQIVMGREWTWADEVSEVTRRLDRIATVMSQIAVSAEPLMNRLAQLETTSTPGPLVPSHGTFRPAQVLLNQGEIGFIDFDSFCQSEPANDLGLFLCALMRAGMDLSDLDEDEDTAGSTSPLDEASRQARFGMVRALEDTFLSEYERHLPVDRQRVALWAALDIMMLVTHGWIKIKMGELHDNTYLLEQYLRANNFVGAQ